jgi:dihydroxy-acid dehydratase
MAILGELDHAGLLNSNIPTILSPTLKEQLDKYDIMQTTDSKIIDFYRAGPASIRTVKPFSQSCR